MTDRLRLRRPTHRELALLGLVPVVLAGSLWVRAERSDRDALAQTRALSGVTEAGDRITLRLDRHARVVALDTRVRARCRGGHPWSVRWYPAEGNPVHFNHDGPQVTAVERQSGPTRDGAFRKIGGELRAFVRPHAGSGVFRMSARFYRGAREVQACESGWVRWAVGPNPRERLALVRPPAPRRSYYPAAPSLAGRISAARRRFIRRVDATCVRTYHRIQRATYLAARRYWRRPDVAIRMEAAYVRAHATQLRMIERLGSPPDGLRAYRAWLGNMRVRVALERRITRRMAAGDPPGARAFQDRVDELKLSGNAAGQRFGLVLCTSNGPDRTPVPD